MCTWGQLWGQLLRFEPRRSRTGGAFSWLFESHRAHQHSIPVPFRQQPPAGVRQVSAHISNIVEMATALPVPCATSRHCIRVVSIGPRFELNMHLIGGRVAVNSYGNAKPN